jgi:hypothetical protein
MGRAVTRRDHGHPLDKHLAGCRSRRVLTAANDNWW